MVDKGNYDVDGQVDNDDDKMSNRGMTWYLAKTERSNVSGDQDSSTRLLSRGASLHADPSQEVESSDDEEEAGHQTGKDGHGLMVHVLPPSELGEKRRICMG